MRDLGLIDRRQGERLWKAAPARMVLWLPQMISFFQM